MSATSAQPAIQTTVSWDCGRDKPWMSKKMCETHYRRFKKNGDPLIIKSVGKPRSFCTVDECDRPAFGKGYCNMHYKRFRRTGDPLTSKVKVGLQNTDSDLASEDEAK